MKFLLFFSLVFSLNSKALTSDTEVLKECNISTFSQIYRLTPNQHFNFKDIIQKSNCDELVEQKFAQILSSIDGNVQSSFIANEINEEFSNYKVSITPQKITLNNLSDFLKTSLVDKSNLTFSDLRLTNGRKVLTLNDGEQINFSCSNCYSYGEKNIKLDMNNIFTGTTSSFWLSSKISAKISVLKANKNIQAQQEVFKTEDFITEDFFTTEPDKFISSFDVIKFFKPNKMIVKGMPITTQDIAPIQLIKYGTPVKLILKNQNINISRTAIPHRSANFGETIELKNPSNNKLITGKVIDFNKVIIEL